MIEFRNPVSNSSASATASSTLRPRTISGAPVDDAGEVVGIERRAADERAVDLGHRHELGDVARLHAAAVLDADRVGGRRRRGRAARRGSRRWSRWRRRGWRCGRCRSPRSARRRRRTRSASAALTPANAPRVWSRHASVGRPASRSSSVSPTHTIGVIPCLSTAFELQVHDLVGLAEELTPLGVPDDHVVDVELGQHQRADLAGERAAGPPSSSSARRARIRSLSASISVCSVRRSVNGGQITTSTGLVVVLRRAGTRASARPGSRRGGRGASSSSPR